jgi:hypothetical protein
MILICIKKILLEFGLSHHIRPREQGSNLGRKMPSGQHSWIIIPILKFKAKSASLLKIKDFSVIFVLRRIKIKLIVLNSISSNPSLKQHLNGHS